MLERKIIVAITGASAVHYAEILIQELLKQKVQRIYLLCTSAGKQVIDYELPAKKPIDGEFSLRDFFKNPTAPGPFSDTIRYFAQDNFFAPIACGTATASDMVIVPCTMGTLARVAQGLSNNLLERAADVILKQRKRLLICPREAPLNRIHLRNMLTLDEMGAIILPPIPAFYYRPTTLEETNHFIVGKILDSLEISHSLYEQWSKRQI